MFHNEFVIELFVHNIDFDLYLIITWFPIAAILLDTFRCLLSKIKLALQIL